MHDYGMNGYPRHRYIFFLAVAALSLLPLVAILNGWVGVALNITAFALFSALFWGFDKHLWRQRFVNQLVGIPDLSGTWQCLGSTDGSDGIQRDWNARITVTQSWSKIAIAIDTDESRSSSNCAVIAREPGHGFRLIYCYANERKNQEKELLPHFGTANVVVSQNLYTADATYFNDYTRRTTGTMKWTRIL